jgi:hypothetical protein
VTAGAHPISNSYWVDPDRFLAGPYPLAQDREASRAAIRGLLAAGVRTVVDLRTPAEPPSCRSLLDKLSSSEQSPLWIGVPIVDGAAPSALQMTSLLDLIDASLQRQRPVYVHCQGGLGRTGTVVACWWVRHGHYAPDEAIEQLASRRQGQPNGHKKSPETAPQFRLVRQWESGR